MFQWRHGTQHNDTQLNDIQPYDTQHNTNQHYDTQHKGLICETQHKTLSITTLSIAKNKVRRSA